MSKEGREIARYFCDIKQLKITQSQFVIQVGIANALLKAGYSKQELVDIIEYLHFRPPIKGFNSLAYIQYVGNEILAKQKASKFREVETFFEQPIEEVKDDNSEKFKMQNKPIIKGQVKF